MAKPFEDLLDHFISVVLMTFGGNRGRLAIAIGHQPEDAFFEFCSLGLANPLVEPNMAPRSTESPPTPPRRRRPCKPDVYRACAAGRCPFCRRLGPLERQRRASATRELAIKWILAARNVSRGARLKPPEAAATFLQSAEPRFN
jgi:hypothetical protein